MIGCLSGKVYINISILIRIPKMFLRGMVSLLNPIIVTVVPGAGIMGVCGFFGGFLVLGSF